MAQDGRPSLPRNARCEVLARVLLFSGLVTKTSRQRRDQPEPKFVLAPQATPIRDVAILASARRLGLAPDEGSRQIPEWRLRDPKGARKLAHVARSADGGDVLELGRRALERQVKRPEQEPLKPVAEAVVSTAVLSLDQAAASILRFLDGRQTSEDASRLHRRLAGVVADLGKAVDESVLGLVADRSIDRISSAYASLAEALALLRPKLEGRAELAESVASLDQFAGIFGLGTWPRPADLERAEAQTTFKRAKDLLGLAFQSVVLYTHDQSSPPAPWNSRVGYYAGDPREIGSAPDIVGARLIALAPALDQALDAQVLAHVARTDLDSMRDQYLRLSEQMQALRAQSPQLEELGGAGVVAALDRLLAHQSLFPPRQASEGRSGNAFLFEEKWNPPTSELGAPPGPLALPLRDWAEVSPESLGLGPPPAVAQGTFTVGGVNSDASIRGLRELNGQPIEALEARMRPGADSLTGFLGRSERLRSVMEADNRQVRDELGTTHQALAFPLKLVRFLVNARAPSIKGWGDFAYRGERFFARGVIYRGPQGSPFADRSAARGDFEVVNARTGKGLKFSELLPDMIERYGFYEGKEVAYRLEPKDIAEVFSVFFDRAASDKPTA